MTDVHISPESERSWTSSTWSKPTSLQEISQEPASTSCTNLANGFGDNRRPSSLLWPARLQFQQGSPWMTGGIFGLLTPPPSLAGSAKHSSSGSIASAAGHKQKKAEWCFFKQRDAFFSSSPDDTPIPEMRTPTPAGTRQTKTLFSGHRSLPGLQRIDDAATLRHRASNVHLAKRPFSTLIWFCLVLSVVLNISLCVYFVSSPREAAIRQ
ncbi:hypothetical protein MTO96_007926 [Rhipicephalus appendiculatus]